MTLLNDLSKPSGPPKRPTKPPKEATKAMRKRASRAELAKLVDKTLVHERNARAHRGDPESLDLARELTTYVRGALAITAPYEADGTPRASGSKEEFWTWLDKLRDLLALRLPYERPRLASVTVHDERNKEDRKPYMTIFEVRVRMQEKGLPVDHLVEGPLLLDHELSDADTDEGKNRGS